MLNFIDIFVIGRDFAPFGHCIRKYIFRIPFSEIDGERDEETDGHRPIDSDSLSD